MKKKKYRKKKEIPAEFEELQVEELTKSKIRKILAKAPWYEFLAPAEHWKVLVACKDEIDALKDIYSGKFWEEISEGKPPKIPEDVQLDMEASIEFYDNFCRCWLKQEKKYAKEVEIRRKKRIQKAQLF